jgi:16S rRNA (guanine527-N7)-methyltransferase
VHNYSVSERRLLELYLEELYRWNARVNLTSVAKDEAWSKHIEESVAMLEATEFRTGGLVVDLGSGAGLPGIPMVMVRPDLRMTLVESDTRKAAFLNHVLGLLSVEAEVLTTRVEELGRGYLRESFDVSVTRAAFAPLLVPEMGLPMVRIGGAVVAAGAYSDAEAHEIAVLSSLCGGELEKVADGGVVIRKVSPTPAHYPRRRPK